MAGNQEILINLLNYKLDPEQRRRKERLILFRYVAVGAGLLMVMLVLYMVKMGALSKEMNMNNQLKLEIQQQNYVLQAKQKDEEVKTTLYQRQKLVQEMEKRKLYYGPMFQDFDQIKLPGVLMTNIEVKAGYVNFTGYITGSSNLGDVIAGFQNSKRFGEILNLNSQLDKDSGEILFNLSVAWKGGNP